VADAIKRMIPVIVMTVYDNIVKERRKDILNIGGNKSAKSKKKTYPSS
jgi:hypothetical protein